MYWKETNMTRKKAKKQFNSFGKTFTLDEARLDVHVLLNRIYDDFESRICENCRYCDKESGQCKILYINTDKDFGCNEFERV